MDRLDQVLKEFQGDVGRARHLLQLIKRLREFGGSDAPDSSGEAGFSWREADELWKASQARRTDLPLLSGSLVLYLAGRFEYFVRQVVQTVAEDMADGVSAYSSLPDKLRGQLMARTLEVARNPRRFGFEGSEAEAFLLNLADNLQGGTNPPKISADVLSVTETNMKDRPLAELMKRLGLASFWPEVGKQAKMKSFLETRGDGETTNQAQARLNSLMDERNQIAHPTGATRFPDPDQVLARVGFLEILAEMITDILRVHLAAFVADSNEVAGDA